MMSRMTDVLTEALGRVRRGERVGLATVVATRGSTPQKVGARALVDAGGRRLSGTLGGGAVEAAALQDAARSLDAGREVVREYELSTAVDDWGLACGGIMVVLTEPLGPEAEPWLRAVAEAADAPAPVAVVTVLPGGGRLLVRDEGALGPVDDVPTREAATALGRRLLAGGGFEAVDLGERRLYGEVFGPAPTLVVAGAGHVGKALAGLARFLGLRVVILDDRPEYATRERFPEADEVHAAPVPEALGRLAVHGRTAIVVAMRHQDLDYAATAAALRSPAHYVGLIGARRKAVLITERLLADGLPPERVRALRAPIGLDLGARTPEEIALSVLSEWLMLRGGASGAALRLDGALLGKASGRDGPAGGAGTRAGPAGAPGA